MSEENLLKTTQGCVRDSEIQQFLAKAIDSVGDADVENRLGELQQEDDLKLVTHIDNLWQEVLPNVFNVEPPTKKSRCFLDDRDQHSTSGQSGVGEIPGFWGPFREILFLLEQRHSNV